jgi:hydrogenase maturation protein HypF
MTDTFLPPATCSLSPANARLRVEIHGAVQGVGFRPFVYRLATELGLTGWVINDTQGVFIEVEGPERALAQFLPRLPAEKPPLAIIQTLESAWLPATGFDRFEIRHSDATGAKTALVLPDVATCADCLADVRDPVNRRYRYPFTNCTNCGPRFSIIEALPYDRPNTTMRGFTLCPACRAEYEHPADRRFHAQPNACPVCGPRLTLYGSVGVWGCGSAGDRPYSHTPTRSGRWSPIADDDAALKEAAAALRAGLIVAVKGLGGFHLIADATNAAAVTRLRERKRRGDKPFAIMARDLETVLALCEVPPEAAALLTSPQAPIVLLRQSQIVNRKSQIANQVAPGNPYLGIMLPYTPLHHLLLAEVGFPVVATSGNLTDEPICTNNEEAFERLGNIADAFLVHDRPIARHVDDSVAWIAAGAPRLLRRARGYAPLPVLLPRPVPTLLAVGAHLKNTVALSVGPQVFISQHIGDLETPEALAAFERVIAAFLRLYEATPVAIAHDMHPNYLSTRWAKEHFGFRTSDFGFDREDALQIRNPQSAICNLVAVQHHHAHLAACLAEHGLDGLALGVAWDGTGYGTDGTIWGGEFLLGDAADFTRVAHLRPFRLPGGDAAVHEPRRVAPALLWEIYGEAALERDDLAPIRAFAPAERRALAQMLRRRVNAPVTTSAGRLFDGVAALIGLQQRVDFEGQAAMALEFIAEEREAGAYPINIRSLGNSEELRGIRRALPLSSPSSPSSPEFPLVLDWQPLIENLLADLRRGVSQGIIAARFHNALVEAIVAVAQAVGQPRVALTGGCFQNRLLVERAARRLTQAGFEALLHRQVPPNDGGISLGQVAVAAAKLTQLENL